VDVRTSRHTINGQDIEFTVVAPTAEDPTTRRVTVTTVADSATLYFDHDDFQLFKSILKEF
jgi:guanyl-specific ribonuclease Sa